jgi:hypothetical protein
VHCNFLSLSWAAKVHFVLKQNDRAMTYDEAIKASKSFGWELQEDQVQAGVKLLTSLKLIETNVQRVEK